MFSTNLAQASGVNPSGETQKYFPAAPGLTGRVIAPALLSYRPTVEWELDQPTTLSWRLLLPFRASQARHPGEHTSDTTNTRRL